MCIDENVLCDLYDYTCLCLQHSSMTAERNNTSSAEQLNPTIANVTGWQLQCWSIWQARFNLRTFRHFFFLLFFQSIFQSTLQILMLITKMMNEKKSAIVRQLIKIISIVPIYLAGQKFLNLFFRPNIIEIEKL